MVYREFILTNTFSSEFDYVKKDKVRLEKFVKISRRECFLTICSSKNKYFFFVVCCKTKEYYLLVIFKKKMTKLLALFDNSLMKVGHLLRIKNEVLIMKNVDYILKDKLNISDCRPLSNRHHRSRSESNHDILKGNNRYDHFTLKKSALGTNIKKIEKGNDTVIYEDESALPKV